MTESEIAVVVIDSSPPRTRTVEPLPRSRADRSHGILEGGLLVAVGLSALAVEGIVSAILRSRRRHRSGRALERTGRDRSRAARRNRQPRTPRRWSWAPLSTSRSRRARGSCGSLPISNEPIRPLTLVAMIPPVDRAARRLEEMATRRNETWQAERSESVRWRRICSRTRWCRSSSMRWSIGCDLTDLVLEQVDLRAVISSIDIDEIVGRVDVTAIVDGLDIDAVAARVDVQKSSIASTWSRSHRV